MFIDLVKIKFEKESGLIKEFSNWLNYAKAGEKFCYHTGEYLFGPLGNLARQALEQHKVILFQRREKNGSFSYWAQRRIHGSL